MIRTFTQFEIQQLNFRLSYNDIKLFLAIAQSLPTLDNGNQERTERLVKDKTVDGASQTPPNTVACTSHIT